MTQAKIFKISIKKDKRTLTGLLQYSWLIITGFIFYIHLYFIGIILVVIFIVGSIILHLKEKRQKHEFIIFSYNYLDVESITSFRINYIDVHKIVLHFRAIKGDPVRGFLTMTGHENTIKIVTKDGDEIIKNIWCETENDYWRLKALGRFLKEQGVDVKMKGFLR